MSIASLSVFCRNISVASSCIDNVPCSSTDVEYNRWRYYSVLIDYYGYFCQTDVRKSKSHTVFPSPLSSQWVSEQGLTFSSPKGKGKASSLDIAPLQSWTAALYNLGSCSWLTLIAVPRRRQWLPRARANGLPTLAASRHTTPSQPR